MSFLRRLLKRPAAAVPDVEVDDDLAVVRARLAADHRRGQRIRDARYPPLVSKDQQIAEFERDMAREARRR